MSRRVDHSSALGYGGTSTPLGVARYMRKTTSRSSIYIPRERESDYLTFSEIVTGSGGTPYPRTPLSRSDPLFCGGNTPPSEVPRNDDTNQPKGPNEQSTELD